MRAGYLVGLEQLSDTDLHGPACVILDQIDKNPGAWMLPDKVIWPITDYLLATEKLSEPIAMFLRGNAMEIRAGIFPLQRSKPVTHVHGLAINALPMQGPAGFTIEGISRPLVSLVSLNRYSGQALLNINITEAYVERILRKANKVNILAQIVVYELLRYIDGLSDIESFAKLAEFNSFQTTDDSLNDLSRDILECAADENDFEFLQNLVDTSEKQQGDIEESFSALLPGKTLQSAKKLVARMGIEAGVLLRMYGLEDYATGKKYLIRPGDIIFQQWRAEVTISDLPAFYTPPYLVEKLKRLLENIGCFNDPDTHVRVVRDIIAYKPSGKRQNSHEFMQTIEQWIDLFVEFSEKNTLSLSLLKTGIMENQDIDEITLIIREMIDIYRKLCPGETDEYHKMLEWITGINEDRDNLGYQLNRFINRIHQEVLQNVFGIFKGWKSHLGDVNTIADKAVSLVVDNEGSVEFFPANKLNIIDYSGDFERGRAVVARSIIERYLTTNVHLRDNCYIDCISLTNKAWFFIDLGVHGANIFIDLDPNKPMISASYAEGDVEDGNMTRLRFLEDALKDLNFDVMRSDVNFTARLDEQKSGIISADELLEKAFRAIQAFASVADFDQEIEDGRITRIALKYHLQRIKSTGTGYPLYIMTQGVGPIKQLSARIDEFSRTLLPVVNAEIDKIGIEKISLEQAGLKNIELMFSRHLNNLIDTGRFISCKTNPVFENPAYEEPEPARYFSRIEDEMYLQEVSGIVSLLDKVVGSSFIGEHDGSIVTVSVADMSGSNMSFYAVRDKNTYHTSKAIAVDGECLRVVSGVDNIICDSQEVLSNLLLHGYNLENISQADDWSVPISSSIQGIIVPAIQSCPGVATGMIRKNRREDVPAVFAGTIFSDTILTPREVARMRDANGFITTDDSTLSHAQLTARTFGKPGVIIRGAVWDVEDSKQILRIPFRSGSFVVNEGDIVTIDAVRAMVNIVGAAIDSKDDFRDRIREIFALLLGIQKERDAPICRIFLQEFVERTDNLGIVKFIIQELFITTTVQQNIHKLEILGLLLENCREHLKRPAEEFLRNIVLDYRRRQINDITTARQKLNVSTDLNESWYVRDRTCSKLRIFQEIDALICPRVGLDPICYDIQIEQIDTLFDAKRDEYETNALNELLLLEKKSCPTDIAILGKMLRIARMLLALESRAEKIMNLCGVINVRQKKIKELFAKSPENLVVDLGQTAYVFADYVGNKAATLGELHLQQPELNIPPGFVLTSMGVEAIMMNNRGIMAEINECVHAEVTSKDKILHDVMSRAERLVIPEKIRSTLIWKYHECERFLCDEEKISEIKRLASMVGIDDADIQQELARLKKLPGIEKYTIQEIIRASGFGRNEIENLLNTASEEVGVFVVVRSSSILEDTHEEMMAGRFQSYPYVRGENRLLESILDCLAYYWVETGVIDNTQPVFVHQQVEADVSMVVNSINLAEDRWNEVIINSAQGAGAGLVSGQVDSDLYFVDAATFTLKRAINTLKRKKCVFDTGRGSGVAFVSIDNRAEQIRPSLSEGQAIKISRLAREIHNVLGYPVDIEAVMYREILYVVQVRPVVLPCKH